MSQLGAVPDPPESVTPGAPPAFECSWRNGGVDAAWVHLAGELDIATMPQLERALRAAQSKARLVVLDLRELTFIDSAGAHTIIRASINARRRGNQLVLLRAPARLDRIFALIGGAEHVQTFDLHPVEPPVQALLQLVAEDVIA